jgi:hypothetical protein
MSSNVGPKGRLYRRERLDGIWVAITIIAMTLIGLVLVGPKTVATVLSYLGL